MKTNNPMYWTRAVVILSIGESELRYDEAVKCVVMDLQDPLGSFAKSDQAGMRDWVVGREWRDGDTAEEVRDELKEWLNS